LQLVLEAGTVDCELSNFHDRAENLEYPPPHPSSLIYTAESACFIRLISDPFNLFCSCVAYFLSKYNIIKLERIQKIATIIICAILIFITNNA